MSPRGDWVGGGESNEKVKDLRGQGGDRSSTWLQNPPKINCNDKKWGKTKITQLFGVVR